MAENEPTKEVRFQDELADKRISEDESLGCHYNKFQLLEILESQDPERDDENSSLDDNNPASDNSSNCKPASKTKQRRRRNRTKVQKGRKSVTLDDPEFVHNSNSEIRPGAAPSPTTKQYKLLKLNLKNLIPENELKRIFGKDVLKEEKSKDIKFKLHLGSSSQRSRFVASAYHDAKLMLLNSGPRMELDELFNQRQDGGSTTIACDSNCPSKKNSKSTNVVEQTNDPNQCTYFKFVHDKNYQIAQSKFLEAAHRGYPRGIVENSSTFPSHVESIIQLSDMMLILEDYKTASELIERALLIFERGFHQRFNFAQADCRLSYKRPENRSFYITIFKHIAYCHRRGLRRTPLEYTKFLLALDPENDPLFTSLMIDFYALRSEEYDYLIEFASNWKHLSKMPNMNFSLALAYFMKAKRSRGEVPPTDCNFIQANECLQKALLRYPNFITQLLDSCSAEPSSALKKCDYFDYSSISSRCKFVPEAVDLLVTLYVQRTIILWKNKAVLSWLEDNVTVLVDKFAKGELLDDGHNIEYWSSFKGPSPRNLLRHIVLSDLKLKIPPTVINSTVLDIDPFPPESIISYNPKVNFQSTTAPDLHSSSFGSLFLRSILPNFSLERQTADRLSRPTPNRSTDNRAQDNQAADAELEGNQDGAPISLDSMQNSIQSVLNSLSNMLRSTDNRHENNDHPDNEPIP